MATAIRVFLQEKKYHGINMNLLLCTVNIKLSNYINFSLHYFNNFAFSRFYLFIYKQIMQSNQAPNANHTGLLVSKNSKRILSVFIIILLVIFRASAKPVTQNTQERSVNNYTKKINSISYKWSSDTRWASYSKAIRCSQPFLSQDFRLKNLGAFSQLLSLA